MFNFEIDNYKYLYVKTFKHNDKVVLKMMFDDSMRFVKFQKFNYNNYNSLKSSYTYSFDGIVKSYRTYKFDKQNKTWRINKYDVNLNLKNKYTLILEDDKIVSVDKFDINNIFVKNINLIYNDKNQIEKYILRNGLNICDIYIFEYYNNENNGDKIVSRIIKFENDYLIKHYKFDICDNFIEKIENLINKSFITLISDNEFNICFVYNENNKLKNDDKEYQYEYENGVLTLFKNNELIFKYVFDDHFNLIQITNEHENINIFYKYSSKNKLIK